METRQLSLFDNDSEYFEFQDDQTSDHTVFRVHASLIYKLGESLIADEVTALSELIKNCYDADASICQLIIDSKYKETINGKTCIGKIEIIDNGCGMNKSTIINGWLTLSNSPKKKMKKDNKTTDKYKRYPLGDKGLGRLSVQKLGRHMQLITKTKESQQEYIVTIPWGDFLKNTTIDRIPINILHNEINNTSSYTRIIIKDLVDSSLWESKEQVDVLSNSISKIISPFRSRQNTFRVIAQVNGSEISTDTKVFEALLGAARAKYTITYRKGVATITSLYKASFFYSRESMDHVLKQRITFTETLLDDFLCSFKTDLSNIVRTNESGFVYKQQEDMLFPSIYTKISGELSTEKTEVINDDPGDFECEIYEYSLDNKYLEIVYQNLEFTNLIDRDAYKELVDRYQGIKVVRDGFLIQGFGEGPGGDWLGLSNTSKTKGKFFDLRNASVIGCVYLTGINNSCLKETTNREGFVADGYYKHFKQILENSINRINRNRYKLYSNMSKYIRAALSNSSVSITEERGFATSIETIQAKIQTATEQITKNSTKISDAKKKLNVAKGLIEESPFVSEESLQSLTDLSGDLQDIENEYESLVRERETIVNEINAIQMDFSRLNGRMQDLFELAGLGISVETFTHEFDASIRNIKEMNQQIVKSTSKTINDLVQHINFITYNLDALRKQMSYFNPGLKYVRAEKQTFDISKFLTEHKSYYEERCKRKKIQFKLNIQTTFAVTTNRGMLNQVFDNLFNNSEYWLDFSFHLGCIHEKVYNIEVKERGYILIWDNGIGISKDMENRLFEPFETKKENGRGLGLYIATSNLNYNSSSIRLLQERNKMGNLYKFEINLLEVTI